MIRRLILLVYVVTVLAVLIICAGVCVGLMPYEVVENEMRYAIGRDETLPVIGCMTLASLILLTQVKKTTGITAAKGDVHLEAGKPGEVKVTIRAIVSVIERAALTISGVREAKATVYRQSGEVPIRIAMTITLSQGYSAPQVSEEVVRSVDDALKVALELSNVPVEVQVEEITHAIIEREKRVV